MIFYFSGTGNSKYIADKLAACFDEELVNIAEAVNNSDFTFDCSDDKYVGFVFPTYAWSIPYVVKEFVEKMELDNIDDDAYVFAINNCGATEGRSLYDFSKLLEDKNIKLSYARSLKLPDNYIILLNVPDEEEQKKMFRSANIKMANIINNITRFKKSVILHTGILFFIYKFVNFMFKKFMSKTSRFNVSDDCVGCGLCAEICNTKAITIEDGKPVWSKNTCVQCLACIHRCPAEAINYGSRTQEKPRYVNPFVHFDKTVEDVHIDSDEEEINEDIAEELEADEAAETDEVTETDEAVETDESAETEAIEQNN